MSQRFRELDGLRGLAALAVVLGHFTGTYDLLYPAEPEAPFSATWGAFGVQLFFLISGYVIFMSARRAQRPSDFVISRVSRLYPVYWVALTVSIVLSVAFSVPHTDIGWINRILNYTMVQRWLLVPEVDEVYWTLAVELQFYVLILLMLFVTRCQLNSRIVSVAVAVWLGVATAVAIWAGPFSRGVAPHLVDAPVKIILNVVLAEWAPLFCAGLFAYMARENRRWWSAAVGSGMLSVIVAIILHSPIYAVHVLVVVLVFFFVIMRAQTRILLWGPIQWYGKISYSLYILHTIPGFVLINQLSPSLGRVPAMFIAFIMVSLLARTLYEVGEARLTGVMRRRLTTWQHRFLSPRSVGSQS